MGLDVGDKRLGVAVTDPFGWTVQPVATIQRKDLQQTLAELKNLLEEYAVEELVVGLPLNGEDAEGPQAKKVRLFERQLKNFLRDQRKPIPILMWDESFTTQEVEEELIATADLSRAKRRKVVDQLAAQRILESYLESLK